MFTFLLKVKYQVIVGAILFPTLARRGKDRYKRRLGDLIDGPEAAFSEFANVGLARSFERRHASVPRRRRAAAVVVGGGTGAAVAAG